ncbi:hypothetical protein Poli38472_013017 [Pythium oligandrum]|uniref:Urease accessory protein UreF n=1 Tax=Pythium oligandrum TaxID=41045 RepID=A0A8K1FHY0_PYTOL|nr:hypothetical protein Poli38472_013017 [Pythium oligandrum]|eukprot:TMW64395.1 hypothetical protein Poli38472_013017 [Pythium oligandrum]
MATTPAVDASPMASGGDWMIWQMVDSLFPTGGFAHSLGLEAAVQENVVKSKDDGVSLRQFLTSTVHQAGNFVLPIVYSSIQATEAAGEDEAALVEQFLDLNARATALYSNHVAKKASLAQGGALLRLAISTYYRTPGDKFQVLVTIRKESKKRKHVGVHHAVVFGVVCGLLGVSASTSQRMYLFFVLRDTLSAATRLNLIGPMEATRIQYEFVPLLEQVMQAKQNRSILDSYSSAPVLDLIQAMHDQLYTRIFNS